MQTSFDALINQFYRIVLLESNATNSDFTRTNNTQSLAGANRDVIQTMDTGAKHTISTFVNQIRIQLTRQSRKTVVFYN